MNAQILCLGAAHIDHKAFSLNPVLWGTKNPVTVTSSHGGVARNVAENLARLDIRVALISRLGNDQDGEQIMADLIQCGIDATHVNKSSTERTASFTALLEPNGELAVAFSDMAIYDQMVFDTDALKNFAKTVMWIADANIPEQELARLARHCPDDVELWAVGTSVIKNEKFLPIVASIDTLIINEQEAAMFAVQRARRMVVTARGHGAKLYEGDECTIFNTVPDEMVDSTGAGDAFAAGLAFGYLQEHSLKRAMPFAFAAAHMTIRTSQTVSASLTREGLLNALPIF